MDVPDTENMISATYPTLKEQKKYCANALPSKLQSSYMPEQAPS